jgi:hypothetical protein
VVSANLHLSFIYTNLFKQAVGKEILMEERINFRREAQSCSTCKHVVEKKRESKNKNFGFEVIQIVGRRCGLDDFFIKEPKKCICDSWEFGKIE